MKKKALIIALSILGALILLVSLSFGIMILSGNRLTAARCIVTDGGALYMVYGESPVLLNYEGDADHKTGDRLLILHSTAFAESYPEQTRASLIMKIGSGDAKDIPLRTFEKLYGIYNFFGDRGIEFSITQNVEGLSFEDYDEIYGWMGAREYLGRAYKKIQTPDGVGGKPEHYVSYIVSAYPDYADGGAYITEIRITDPLVGLYGLTVNSSFEQFHDVLEKMGFDILEAESTETIRTAQRDGIKCKFIKGDIPTLIISAAVSNRYGIVF